MAEVVNARNSEYDVLIARPSKWGNPFQIGRDGSRETGHQHVRGPHPPPTRSPGRPARVGREKIGLLLQAGGVPRRRAGETPAGTFFGSVSYAPSIRIITQ